MPFKVAALILPLSLDTAAVSAALGAAGIDRRQRLRLTMLFAAFEAGMPLVGFAVGDVVGNRLGDVSDYLAVAALAVLGVLMLREHGGDDGARLLARSHGVAALALAVSISIDELTIGLVIGLLRLAPLLIIALIAAQAVIAVQLGSRLGARLASRAGEAAERLAGVILLALAGGILAVHLRG